MLSTSQIQVKRPTGISKSFCEKKKKSLFSLSSCLTSVSPQIFVPGGLKHTMQTKKDDVQRKETLIFLKEKLEACHYLVSGAVIMPSHFSFFEIH